MTILIIVGIIVLLGIIFASMYNSLVKLRNNREKCVRRHRCTVETTP